MTNDIYTVSQTAIYLKVCEKTVRKLIKNNLLIASRVGNSWRIQKKDIEKYLDSTKNNKGG